MRLRSLDDICAGTAIANLPASPSGRKGVRLRRASRAPILRTVLDRSDLRRSAADAYARALVGLHAARSAAEVAYWSGEGAAIRRALRWVAAANVVADMRYEALLAVG